MRDLKEIRKDIDKIDNQLIELFKQRMDCARDVGIYKQANNIPVLNEGRENEILDAVEEKGGEYGASARLLYSNIMELSRALQHNIVGSGKELKSVINNASTDIPSSGIKVAYQGIKGANGHEATLRLFPRLSTTKALQMYFLPLTTARLHSVFFLLKTQAQALFRQFMTLFSSTVFTL